MLGIPVMNTVTDVQYFEGFSRVFSFPCDNASQNKSNFVGGAVEQVKWVMDNLVSARITKQLVRLDLRNETYDERINTILRTCGLGE
jgi:hypothetical protein